MSLEEINIFIFAILSGLAAMFFMEPETCKSFCLKLIGHQEDVSESIKPLSQFTIPIVPTYRGQSILSTPNTDKPKAEAAINTIYTESGLKAPLIIWTQSPLANVLAKAAIDYFTRHDNVIDQEIWHGEQSILNNNIRAHAWQCVCEAGWSIGDEGIGHEAWSQAKLYEYRDDRIWRHIPPSEDYEGRKGLAQFSWNTTWNDITDIVKRRSNDWLVDLQVNFLFEKQFPDGIKCSGTSRAYYHESERYKRNFGHQKNLNCLPPQVPDTDHRHFSYPTDMCSDFQTLRDTAGWVMPYTNICFVSERPEHLELDENERLHCETGPALCYRDGFSVHAWHGAVFPEEWIKTKPTASEALYWRNIEQRRVACEMLGWESILNELDCVSLDKDEDPEIGELVSVTIPGIGEDKFLRVSCGTGRNFALPVPPYMITARQANAWTWGLRADQYNPEVRT